MVVGLDPDWLAEIPGSIWYDLQPGGSHCRGEFRTYKHSGTDTRGDGNVITQEKGVKRR